MRARHQVSLPQDLSFPTRPGSPILIGSHLEGSPAENDAPLWSGEELTSRRTSLAQYLSTSSD